MTGKKTTTRVTILNEEYAIRTDTSPEHAHEVANYLDAAPWSNRTAPWSWPPFK